MCFDLWFNYLSKNCPFLSLLFFFFFPEQTAANMLGRVYFKGKAFSQTNFVFIFLSVPEGSLPIFISDVPLSCSGT